MDNPEKLATQITQDNEKTEKTNQKNPNIIYFDTICKQTQITLIRHEPSYKQLEGTLRDFKNCVTDNLFWAKLLYFGVFVKEIMQKLCLNHFIGKLSNSSILGVKFQFS